MKADLLRTTFLQRLLSRRDYDLFGSDRLEDLHWGKLFIHLFGEYYSRYKITQSVNHEGLINNLMLKYSLSSSQVIRIDRAKREDFHELDYEYTEVLLILKEGLLFGISDDRLEIMYGPEISKQERDEILEIIELNKAAAQPLKKFYMVQHRWHFELTNFDVKPFTIDLDTHYNDDFRSVNNLITTSLKGENKNGLIMLHGKYGSGKTYYLRHLISNINRKFIYFPVHMMELLNSPEFIPFISHEPNSVLILEDCENLLVHRESGSTNASALSILLNLSDGLLSDALSINVICTFNSSINKIDDAVLRKGRLIARYEFKELETPKAQRLAKQIGKEILVQRPMTVSEIYNLEAENYENPKSKAIGFCAS